MPFSFSQQAKIRAAREFFRPHIPRFAAALSQEPKLLVALHRGVEKKEVSAGDLKKIGATFVKLPEKKKVAFRQVIAGAEQARKQHGLQHAVNTLGGHVAAPEKFQVPPRPGIYRWLRRASLPFEIPYLAIFRLMYNAVPSGKKMAAQGKPARLSVSNEVLAMQVFRRISALTSIPEHRLVPTATHNPGVGLTPAYLTATHEIIMPRENDFREHHELLHATQQLLAPSTVTFSDYLRQEEPAACYYIATKTLNPYPFLAAAGGVVAHSNAQRQIYLAAAVAAGLSLGSLLTYSRELVVKRAVRDYGPDGWIALHAHGKYDPLFALAILRRFEKQGYLTKQGFTRKGKKWISGLKPQIEARLQAVEKNRKSEAKERITRST